jgi:hypothetical protein
MQVTPFIIGPDERVALKALAQLASEHPVDMDGLLERLKDPANKRRHMQQMNQQSVRLPFDYLVTFSIERNHPGGRVARHLSVSSPNPNRVPRPQAVWMVAEELGFTGVEVTGEVPPLGSTIWLEKLQGHGEAVNLVQLIGSVEEGRA